MYFCWTLSYSNGGGKHLGLEFSQFIIESDFSEAIRLVSFEEDVSHSFPDKVAHNQA